MRNALGIIFVLIATVNPLPSKSFSVVKKFSLNGTAYELIYNREGRSGRLTDLVNGSVLDFTTYQCKPGSKKFIDQSWDRVGYIGHASWSYIIWALCTNGIDSL